MEQIRIFDQPKGHERFLSSKGKSKRTSSKVLNPSPGIKKLEL
jgi:hypothetical protein